MRFPASSWAGLIFSTLVASVAGATGASIEFFEATPVALSGSGRQVLLAGVYTDPTATPSLFRNQVAGLWDLDERSYERIDAGEFGFGTAWADLSTDGTTIVGTAGSRAPGGEIGGPFRWRKGSGFEQLETTETDALRFNPHTTLGTSGNGDLVIGSFGPGLRFGDPTEGVLWDASGDLVEAPSEPEGVVSFFEHISDDGLTLAGIRQEVLGDRVRSTAIRWTEEAGPIELVPAALLASTSRTTALSGDGAVAFGTYRLDSPEFPRAFVVDSKHGFLDLGNLLPDALTGSLLASSQDGRVAVGDVSLFGRAEGSFVTPTEAILWESGKGARRLAEILGELGVDLRGARLQSAIDVSADGTRVLGRTSEGYAFVAVIPEPSTAILMGLGLLGLAAGSTRSRRPPRR